MTSYSTTQPRFVTLERAQERIRELSFLNAFISLTDEEGDGPVVAVKDLIDVRGTVTTGGGDILPRVPASEDAPVIEQIREYGCVVIGKTNLHEWAFGVTSANDHYGVVRNPRDPSRIPGGSSGGSAVAVAAGMCDWAIGSDTGGSIRIPASLCGVVGIKPTFGLVNIERTIPLAPSLDTLGPLAPNVEAAAQALTALTGIDDLTPEKAPSLGTLRIGIPADWVSGLDAETEAVWERVSAGIPEIPFPDRARMARVGLDILYAEAAAYHRTWLEAHPDRYGSEVRDRLRDALRVTGADYVDAVNDRKRLREEVAEGMRDLDAILVPATACVAPPIGTPNVGEPLTRYTRPFNTTGQPAVTIPALTPGLPVGIQVVGTEGEDRRTIEVALALEASWRAQRMQTYTAPLA